MIEISNYRQVAYSTVRHIMLDLDWNFSYRYRTVVFSIKNWPSKNGSEKFASQPVVNEWIKKESNESNHHRIIQIRSIAIWLIEIDSMIIDCSIIHSHKVRIIFTYIWIDVHSLPAYLFFMCQKSRRSMIRFLMKIHRRSMIRFL